MGLDISTKNKEYHLNWGGTSAFSEWSKENLGVDPFPGWDGGNGVLVVFKKNPEDSREIKGSVKSLSDWIEAFEKYQAKEGGETGRFEYEVALEWYWILKDALVHKYISYF
ncbi:TPA: hypothetical protein DEP90_02830 [Patescibacteria group bacterium]|nr:hypothetical protein [Patescibacteria group bacterium]